jgi:hypothetical protein
MDTYSWEDTVGKNVGDSFYIKGKRYKLLKKTTTAIAAKRWYWFDVLFEKLFKTEENG